jgi:hypothetical protein
MDKDTAEIMQMLLQNTLNEISAAVNPRERKGLVIQSREQKLARVWGFDHYLKPQLREFAAWLENSNEETNYTYELTEGNRKQLAAFVDAVAACGLSRAFGFFDELLQDQALRDHLNQLSGSGLSRREYVDRDVGVGRRLGWYAIIRALKPALVVETGVEKGLGSIVIASALLRNRADGFHGEYLGTDINPHAGFLFKEPYASCGRIVIGDSIETLKKLEVNIDVFINDSDHSFEYEAAEYQQIAGNLGPDAVVLSDNAHETAALFDFSVATGRKFLFFAEQPLNHFYPGAGIGAAFRPPERAAGR